MCEAWDYANNTGWLALNIMQDDEGLFFFYTENAPGATIEYCPWCGVKLPDDQHE